jgi:hypothetical protein
MNAISQMVTQQFADAASKQIAARLGVSEGIANMAVQVAAPLILAALARNAAQPEKAEALHQAVVNDHDGSILDNITGYLSDPQTANGAAILEHVLGGQRSVVENNLAHVTGLDQRAAGNLMEIVAPLVLGAVGRKQQQHDFDSSGLAQYLGEQQEKQEAAPGMMGMLSSMLDFNHDEEMTDDRACLAGNFLK